MRSWRAGLRIHRFHDVLLVAKAQVHGHRRLTKRDAVFGAWTRPPERGPLDRRSAAAAEADIPAPNTRARSLLNGGMASSLGLHPAARRLRHRRFIAPQTAGVDVERTSRVRSRTWQYISPLNPLNFNRAVHGGVTAVNAVWITSLLTNGEPDSASTVRWISQPNPKKTD
jgi:hypothetical protein